MAYRLSSAAWASMSSRSTAGVIPGGALTGGDEAAFGTGTYPGAELGGALAGGSSGACPMGGALKGMGPRGGSLRCGPRLKERPRACSARVGAS